VRHRVHDRLLDGGTDHDFSVAAYVDINARMQAAFNFMATTPLG
jgi:hypothetical protein